MSRPLISCMPAGNSEAPSLYQDASEPEQHVNIVTLCLPAVTRLRLVLTPRDVRGLGGAAVGGLLAAVVGRTLGGRGRGEGLGMPETSMGQTRKRSAMREHLISSSFLFLLD